jgi:hypothetical protein
MKKGPPPPPSSLSSGLLGKAPTDLLVQALRLGETAKERGHPLRSPEQDRALLVLCTKCPGLMQNALKKAWLIGFGGVPPFAMVQRKPMRREMKRPSHKASPPALTPADKIGHD